MFSSTNFWVKIPASISLREKVKVGTPNFFARSKTKASALLEAISAMLALSECWKYSMIFSALEPLPEARMARRFMCRIDHPKVDILRGKPKSKKKGGLPDLWNLTGLSGRCYTILRLASTCSWSSNRSRICPRNFQNKRPRRFFRSSSLSFLQQTIL